MLKNTCSANFILTPSVSELVGLHHYPAVKISWVNSTYAPHMRHMHMRHMSYADDICAAYAAHVICRRHEYWSPWVPPPDSSPRFNANVDGCIVATRLLDFALVVRECRRARCDICRADGICGAGPSPRLKNNPLAYAGHMCSTYAAYVMCNPTKREPN